MQKIGTTANDYANIYVYFYPFPSKKFIENISTNTCVTAYYFPKSTGTEDNVGPYHSILVVYKFLIKYFTNEQKDNLVISLLHILLHAKKNFLLGNVFFFCVCAFFLLPFMPHPLCKYNDKYVNKNKSLPFAD